MNKEKTVFIICIVFALVAYIFTSASGAGILLAVFIIYGVSAFAYTRLFGAKTEAKIISFGEAKKNDDVKISLNVKNNSRMPFFSGLAEIELENILTSQKSICKILLPSIFKKIAATEFEINSPYCGKLQARLCSLEISDPLYIFRKKINGCQAEAFGYIMPDEHEIEINQDVVAFYDMESYRFADGVVGTDPSETVGIREYMHGDSIRSIHWKLSAKIGETLVKEHGFPIDSRLMVIIDKGILSDDEKKESGTDKITEFAVSLSMALLRMDISHSAGWYNALSDEFETVQISSPDDIRNMATRLIGAPAFSDTLSAPLRYIESGGAGLFSGYIVASLRAGSREDMEDIDKLELYGKTEVYGRENFI